MRERLAGEWEYLLWLVGWKDYCLQCDEIASGWKRRRHRNCHCGGMWTMQ